MRNGWDDEQLLGALGEAMRARQAVPSWFVAMGKNAYAWHNIDAELAQLTYDSHADTEQLAFVRSETASIRALTFTSAHLSLELEVGEDSLLGPGHPAAGRDLGDVHQGGPDYLAGRRERLFRRGAHPGQPVPAAVPYLRRC